MERKRKVAAALGEDAAAMGPATPWPMGPSGSTADIFQPAMHMMDPHRAHPLAQHPSHIYEGMGMYMHPLVPAMQPSLPHSFQQHPGHSIVAGLPVHPYPSRTYPVSAQPGQYVGSSSGDDSIAAATIEDDMREPTRDSMREYLNAPQDKTVVIFNSRVAQKSYGNEKRFLCPPPCLYFVGNNWKLEADTSIPSVFIGIDEGGADSQQISIEAGAFCAAKNLFISDSDKRKNFSLYAKLQFASRDLGIFKSKPIKVISKPSKKKQSTKNTDMCIAFGTDISLFNRIRSQTISTKYLRAVRGSFVGSGSQWSALTLLAVGTDGVPSKAGGLLQYGTPVVLRCAITGTESGRLVVRKVDKNCILLDGTDPVSQLHKVAFQSSDSEGGEPSFLGLRGENVSHINGTLQADGKSVAIDDAATWTIIGTDRVRYTFCESLGPVTSPVTPVPLFEEVKQQNKRLVELHGENFMPNLKVWFADAPAETLYRCAELLVCSPPPIGQIRDCGWTHVRKRTEVRLFLVRDDGVVYKTDCTYTYAAERLPSTAP
eukprot:Opistho-2@72991